MSSQQEKGQQVAIKILDKELLIACPEGAEDKLYSSANYLDEKMREIRDSGKVVGNDKIAIMAALNISYELIQAQEAQIEHLDSRLKSLNQKIDRSLSNTRATPTS